MKNKWKKAYKNKRRNKNNNRQFYKEMKNTPFYQNTEFVWFNFRPFFLYCFVFIFRFWSGRCFSLYWNWIVCDGVLCMCTRKNLVDINLVCKRKKETIKTINTNIWVNETGKWTIRKKVVLIYLSDRPNGKSVWSPFSIRFDFKIPFLLLLLSPTKHII